MNRKTFTLIIGLFFTVSAFASDEQYRNSCFSDSSMNKKKLQKNVLRLFPNPTVNGIVSVSSTGNNGVLHVYVFDLSGTLVSQLTLKDKEKKTISNLSKGIYMYDVFKEDESVEGGRIIVK